MKHRTSKYNPIFYIIFTMILIVAAIVRCRGIGFGLPHTECRPDETIIVHIAMEFFKGDPNPHFFRYPTLYMYIMFFFYSCRFAVGLLIGNYASVQDFIAERHTDASTLYLMARYVSAFFGTATVAITYLIAKKFHGKKTAIVSAMFLALAYLHVRESHFGVTDVTAVFFVMSSMLFIVNAFKTGQLKHYLWAALLAGLATSTKYNGIILIVPIFATHYMNVARERESVTLETLIDKRIVLSATVLTAGFLIGTPFALIDFGQLINDFLFELGHLGKGHGIIIQRGWLYHVRFSLFHGLGWPLLITGILGMILLAFKDTRKWIALCSFPIFFYIIAGKGYTVFVRYALFLVPFLCITAAVFIVYLCKKLTTQFGTFAKNAVLCIAVGLIILPSAINVIKFDTLQSKEDNRLIAAKWINKNIPKGSIICQTGSFPGRIRLIPGYRQWYYDKELESFTFINKQKDGHPEYMVVEQSDLVQYGKLTSKLKQLLNKHYSEQVSFVANQPSERGRLYDQQDAFYTPFAGFNGVVRPGPNLYIYKINQDKK